MLPYQLNSLAGIAVLDNGIGGKLRGSGNLQIDLQEVRLGGDESLAGDGEPLEILQGPGVLGPGRANGTDQDHREDEGRDGRPIRLHASGHQSSGHHGEAFSFVVAESSRAVTSVLAARRG